MMFWFAGTVREAGAGGRSRAVGIPVCGSLSVFLDDYNTKRVKMYSLQYDYWI